MSNGAIHMTFPKTAAVTGKIDVRNWQPVR